MTARAALLCLPDALPHAVALGKALGLEAAPLDIHHFPDGEMRVRVPRAAPLTLVYASLDLPDAKLIALLFASEALRRAGAKHLVLITPYMAYMRQDMAFQPGDAISQRVVGQMLAGAFDAILTVDAHLHRTPRIEDVFPGIEAVNLAATPAIAHYLRGKLTPDTLILGPDEEAAQWVAALAQSLERESAVARKTRHGDRTVEISLPPDVAIKGRAVLLVDDIVSSGGTLMQAARQVLSAGAASIDAVIVHALFPPAQMADFIAAGIRTLISTTSVIHPTNAIPLADLLADAVRTEVEQWQRTSP